MIPMLFTAGKPADTKCECIVVVDGNEKSLTCPAPKNSLVWTEEDLIHIPLKCYRCIVFENGPKKR